MLRALILFNLILVVQELYSQQHALVIEGNIVDNTGISLPYARIVNLETKKTVIADQRGDFYINMSVPSEALRISYIGYITLDTILAVRFDSDTIHATFVLTPSVNQLTEVVITTEPFDQVYETFDLNILDYTFFGQNILLLVNSKEKYQIRLLDRQEKILTKQNLSFKPLGFLKDCLGILHVISEDTLYPVHFDAEEFTFPHAIPIEDFISFIEPCVASNDTYFFLKNRTDFNQTIEYITQRKIDNQYSTLHIVNDSDVVNDVTEYALRMKLTCAPSMTGEIFSQQDIRAARDKFEDQMFFEMVVTNPTYAPLVKVKRRILIFDHLADTVFVYNSNCENINRFKIDYHLDDDWVKIILTDETANHVYIVHQQNGIYNLSELNTESGELLLSTQLTEHTYPEKIKIKDGWIYYLYNAPSNEGYQKLYRVKLNE